MATNSLFLWGAGYENQLLVGQPLYDLLTDRVPREGSQWGQGPSGIEDAWITGRDYTLWCTARWIPDGGDGSLASPLSGPTGWQAFFDYARDKNPFRFVPDATYLNAYVDACYLVDPLAKGPLGALSPDILRNVPFQIRNATVDFHMALRGLLFEYAVGGSITDPVVYTFARADASTCATYLGLDGLLHTVAAGVLRDRHYVAGVRGTLLEATRTNVVLWSRDCSNAAWTKSNVTALKDQVGVDGVAASASSLLATAGNGTCLQAITLGSSARLQSAWVKRLTGSGVVQMTTDGGATWTAITVTAAWTRVTIPTQTLANPSVGFRLVTNADKIAVDYVQNETGIFPTTAIATTTVAVTRATDALSTPFLLAPQAMTWYVRFIEGGSALTVNDGLCGVGGNGSPALFLRADSGVYRLMHHSVADASSAAAASPVLGDLVELRGVLNADGSVQLGQSLNGAAEVVAAASAANPLLAAWASPVFALAVGPGGTGTAAFRTVRVAPGVRTLAQMRAL
jgi:hypothetical protein